MRGENFYLKLVFCLFIVVPFVIYVDGEKSVLPDPSEFVWENFKKKFNKHYSPEEDVWRREIFQKTVEEVETHNELYLEGKVSWFEDVNNMSDWTPEEWKEIMGYITEKP